MLLGIGLGWDSDCLRRSSWMHCSSLCSSRMCHRAVQHPLSVVSSEHHLRGNRLVNIRTIWFYRNKNSRPVHTSDVLSFFQPTSPMVLKYSFEKLLWKAVQPPSKPELAYWQRPTECAPIIATDSWMLNPKRPINKVFNWLQASEAEGRKPLSSQDITSDLP